MTKVLVIGLDGATFDVIHPLVRSGHLPSLARLMKTGSFGPLRSTIQPSSEQAWASFMTGKNNGKHGIFSFVKRRPNTYEFDLIDGRSRAGKSLWQILSERGLRSIVVNVPLTYPPESVNGIVIGGLLSPGVNSQFTYPPSIYDDLVQEIGRYTIDIETPRTPVKPEDLDQFNGAFVNRLKDMIASRTKAMVYLMNQHPWDFCMVVYTALDRAQHKLWRFMDSSHPTYDPALGERYGHLIPDLYAFIDEQVGQLLNHIDDDTVVFVVSDHGFSSLDKSVYINKWLAQRGYLVFRERGSLGSMLQGLYGLSYRLAIKVLPLAFIKRLAKRLTPGAEGKAFSRLAFGDVDWSCTQAYCVGGSNIYLNLRGREPQGIIERGSAEYERVVGQIVSDLREIFDPETEEPIVGDIYLGRELYAGPFIDDVPDIAFLYRDSRYRGVVFDSGLRDDTIVSRDASNGIVGDLSGTHDLDGILIAKGPTIAQQRDYSNAHIMDMAPTILYTMGQPVPDDMDGRVLVDIFVSSFGQMYPVEYQLTGKENSLDLGEEGSYSEKDQGDVEERLRSLGYLD